MKTTNLSPSMNGDRHGTKAAIEAAAQRPKTLAVRVQGIPRELRQLRQWVCWRWTQREDANGKRKWTKEPINPNRGGHASSTNPATWGTFEGALAAYREHDLDGAGFVFAADDPYAGVDLDDCRDPHTGDVAPWAQAIIDKLGSYCEISPTGTGVKIFLKGKVPSGGNRKGSIEMYDHGRFFCMTGHQVEGTPSRILHRPNALAQLHRELFPPPAAPSLSADRRSDSHVSQSAPTPNGLADAELISRAKAAKNGDKFSSLWAGDISGYRSNSEADLALCSHLAFWAGPHPDRIDRLFRQGGLMRPKWDREDYRTSVITKAVQSCTEVYSPREVGVGVGDEAEGEQKQTQAQILVEMALVSGIELFRDPAGDGYASVDVQGHRETYRLRSKGFHLWLRRLYHDAHRKPPGAQAVQDALGVLEGKAIFDGPTYPVFVRLAGHEGRIYLDLCNDAWQAVEIDAHGWRVVDHPPVRFRRAKAMMPLPCPIQGGTVEALRPFVNVTDRDWPLVLAFLVASLRPTGPYPLLALYGEQGSAKSTTARLLRNLIDPNAAPVRVEPKEVRDLAITANNGWTVVLDNVSYLPPWLSDALCRLSTGGGFSTRTLYENDEESIFCSLRPAIVNGIEEVVVRGDLLDRALPVCCPNILDDMRRTEADFWAAFEAVRPRVLGALLDVVASGLRNLPTVKLERVPRMADFASWAVACEPALGQPEGAFLRAYARSVRSANSMALEASVIAAPLRKFVMEMTDDGWWTGTATDLLSHLTTRVSEQTSRSREWPRLPHVLSGKIKRLAPNLRREGIEVEFGHHGRTRSITLRKKKSGKQRKKRKGAQDE